ncbi:LOW QUALITY PROTEIN: glyoxylate/hydroxypyruvate reductase B-like [Erethizon dorsatum]
MHSQPQGKGREGGHICRWEQEGFHTRETGYQLAVLPDTVHFPINWVGQEVSRASLGVVGMGTIGYKIAQRDKAFDMKIPYYNRNCSKLEEEEVGATFCERLDDLLQQSDFVTLALMPQTQAGAAVMKLSAILVNIGRELHFLEVTWSSVPQVL